jgi:hypothetical protein
MIRIRLLTKVFLMVDFDDVAKLGRKVVGLGGREGEV